MAGQSPNTNTKSIEESLWDSADKLRGTVESSEYKHVVLGLIFLKFASDKFEARRVELIVLDLRHNGAGANRAYGPLLDALELIDISNNIGDCRSLLCHPASTTHANMGAEARAEMQRAGLPAIGHAHADADRSARQRFCPSPAA